MIVDHERIERGPPFTISWTQGGAILVLVPFLLDQSQRTIAVYMIALVYASGAIANCWATRGRHPGWFLLAVTTVLALMGA